MKKNIIIALGLIVLLLFTSVISYALTNKKHAPSDYKIGVTYEQAIEADKPILALFYVDWCTYCLKFMPKFRLVDSLYKDKFSIVMINAENPDYKDVVVDMDMAGFPSLYLLDPKYDNKVYLSNAIYSDLGKLRKELDRFLRIRLLLDSK